MSTHETVDLSKVVVILGSFVGVNDILKLSENSRYEFRPPTGNADTSWKGGQPREQELNRPFLALTIGEHLYDPRGWVLGSDRDSDECDLQLAETNQMGISRRFIRIDISPATHNLRVTDSAVRYYNPYTTHYNKYIHSENITHRDVKPANVLVEKQGRKLTVKLADFATSIYNAIGKMDTFTGTEKYMAPELFESPRRYTDKVDMWSLGLIGMQLFTTWDPAGDDGWNPRDFGPWMRQAILPRLGEAPEQYRPLLKGLLRKNPKRRWSAQKCLIWLWKYLESDAPDGEGPVNSRKRSASKLDEPLLNTDDCERRRRSPGPSLSTARVRAAPRAEQHSEESSSLPDTLSPGAWVPELVTAPTPTPDDGLSDLGDVEAEDGSSDDELEDDWGKDEENE
ncbi:Calcium/calmodulin-dependent protein kinase type IV [Metarhizium rileyi]|uniref:Calcium/calmodulin-dependent protein kinase type IV n=1 Tax=Metarhizium rileyi (strain RCEF 4871) TaxID=1649241 RepID=A0A166VZR0_METRR|nr:Calcium/calmodulin-dependent protein kinase type IV [Metarhizium rileyi RCEF 4871]